MAIPAKLSRRLYEILGDDAAHDMGDWMQRVDAQRAELRDLNESNFARVDARLGEHSVVLQAALARYDERFDVLEAAIGRHDSRFSEMQADLKGQAALMADLRRDVDTGFARLETRIEQRTADIMKWSFLFWIGSVATLVGALRFLP